MPATSKKQQRLAGMATAFLKGEMPTASSKVRQFAKMGRKKAKEFTKPAYRGLPESAGRGKRSRGATLK